MQVSTSLSPLDARIVHCLHVHPRASWKEIATVLSESSSTVARRGSALISSGAVVVTGLLDHLRCGLGVSVYVRFGVRPGETLSFAQYLAEAPDARFVTTTMGSPDVVAELVISQHQDLLGLLKEFSQRTSDVQTESALVVRKFKAYEEWVPLEIPEPEVRELRSKSLAVNYGHASWKDTLRLSPLDMSLAKLLKEDGRCSYEKLAHQLGVSASTAARRVQSLTETGALRFRTLTDVRTLGYNLEMIVWLSVQPHELESAGVYLADDPSTRFVSVISGQRNLMVHVLLREYSDLLTYMTVVIGQVPGLQQADYGIMLETLKRAWIRTPEHTDGTPLLDAIGETAETDISIPRESQDASDP